MPCHCSDPTLAPLGHDAVGHAVAATLVRGGLDRHGPAGLAALSDSDVLALANAGPVFLERFRAAYGGERSAPRRRPTRPDRQRRAAPADRAACGCPADLLDLGHDIEGHRIANVLARSGLLAASEPSVAVMSDDELRWLSGIGPGAVARIRRRLAPPPAAGLDLVRYDSERSKPRR